MKPRFSNADIAPALTELRNMIRDGRVTLYFRSNEHALRNAVASALNLQDPDAFNSENFNGQTLKRFANLFAVPTHAHRFPSQDDAAVAIQNFINRRRDPWRFFNDDAVLATEVSPINV